MKSIYREKMTPDTKTKIDWFIYVARGIKYGIILGLAGALIIGTGAISKSCLDSSQYQRKVSEQEREEKRNAPCQDSVTQLGCPNGTGTFTCPPGAELIVNHAVVECRCKK